MGEFASFAVVGAPSAPPSHCVCLPPTLEMCKPTSDVRQRKDAKMRGEPSKAWEWFDTATDIITVFFAVVDIAMDVWICRSYYYAGRTRFFNVSLALLCIAQISFASLFTIQYKRVQRVDSFWTQAITFICVLPVAQLVPLFIYAESFESEPMERFMRWLSLQRSDPPRIQPGEDLTLFKIRCKLMSHLGFLVEACVEAVPQSVLQLVAMQHAGEANLMSIVSILFSISCLASKGYVGAFSIYLPQFTFNGLAIAAD